MQFISASHISGRSTQSIYVRRKFDDDWLFLFYMLESLSLGVLNAATGVPGLTRRDAHEINGVFHPLPEQRRIARVLKLADEAIAKAQAELDATREVKRSLMATLFVEGIPGRHRLYNDSPMGRIPASWEIRRIRDVLACPPAAGTSPQSRPEPPGTPNLNVSCIGGGLCDPTLVTYVDVSDAEKEHCRAETGDFFVL